MAIYMYIYYNSFADGMIQTPTTLSSSQTVTSSPLTPSHVVTSSSLTPSPSPLTCYADTHHMEKVGEARQSGLAQEVEEEHLTSE